MFVFSSCSSLYVLFSCEADKLFFGEALSSSALVIQLMVLVADMHNSRILNTQPIGYETVHSCNEAGNKNLWGHKPTGVEKLGACYLWGMYGG